MISDEHVSGRQDRRARMLGIFWLIYGAIRLIAALWLISFSNTATLMFGALLNRVADPFALMNDFHVLYTIIIVFVDRLWHFGDSRGPGASGWAETGASPGGNRSIVVSLGYSFRPGPRRI